MMHTFPLMHGLHHFERLGTGTGRRKEVWWAVSDNACFRFLNLKNVTLVTDFKAK